MSAWQNCPDLLGFSGADTGIQRHTESTRMRPTPGIALDGRRTFTAAAATSHVRCFCFQDLHGTSDHCFNHNTRLPKSCRSFVHDDVSRSTTCWYCDLKCVEMFSGEMAPHKSGQPGPGIWLTWYEALRSSVGVFANLDILQSGSLNTIYVIYVSCWAICRKEVAKLLSISRMTLRNHANRAACGFTRLALPK